MSQVRTFGKRVQANPVSAVPRPETVAVTQAPAGLIARLAARIPWFTLALSGVLVARFVQELRSATDYEAPFSPGYYSLLAAGASSRDLILGHGEWWRLFTASVLFWAL